MNGKELLERGLRRGFPLWQIEDELDWRENQGPRWAEYDVRQPHEPVVRRSRKMPPEVWPQRAAIRGASTGVRPRPSPGD